MKSSTGSRAREVGRKPDHQDPRAFPTGLGPNFYPGPLCLPLNNEEKD